MRWVDKYRPRELSGVIGQTAAIRYLTRFAADPHADCLLLQGPGGTGKTSAAWALAHALGCDVLKIRGSELDVETVKDLPRRMAGRQLFGGEWNYWLIEELEALHPKAVQALKDVWEHLGRHNLVVATSNVSSEIHPVLLQRFTVVNFPGGNELATAGNEFLAETWLRETSGEPLPHGWRSLGFNGKDYSLRTALKRLEQCYMSREPVECAA